jgi:acyl-CoA synthetase (AMP-forming)/AMP-acid ligase II
VNILADFLARAESFGARAAIIEPGGRSIGFAELAARSDRVAAAWRAQGLREGMRVILALPLGIELYVGLAALWRLGAVAVFPEPAMGLKGFRAALAASAPQAFLAGGWYRALRFLLPDLWRMPMQLRVREGDDTAGLADLSPEAPALISFTSGSTGAPKAISRSHGFLAAQNAAVAQMLTAEREGEIDLVAFPVFVVANLALGVASLLPNWKLTDPRGADPAAICAYAARHGAGRALVPPSICEALAGMSAPTPFARIFTGGGPVYPDLIARLRAIHPQLRLTVVYGSTEAEPIAQVDAENISDADWAAMRAGQGLLAGPPVPCARVKIHDDEIVVTGDHVNKGYLDPSRDASTKLRIAGEIWHRTGDAGRFDGAGRLWLLGRIDGKAGGLYPFAVECAARTWPGVRRAALIEKGGRAVLALEGEATHESDWRARAASLGVEVRRLAAIPLDRRHASKVDYAALRARL